MIGGDGNNIGDMRIIESNKSNSIANTIDMSQMFSGEIQMKTPNTNQRQVD